MQTPYLRNGSAALVFAALATLSAAQAEDIASLKMPPGTSLGSTQSAHSLSYGRTTYGQPELGLAQPGYSPSIDSSYGRPASSGLSAFGPQVGLGVQVSGQMSTDEPLSFGQVGIGLDLMLRAHPRWSLEPGAEYQPGSTLSPYAGQYGRTDVPILTGLRVYLGPIGWSAAPYMVAVFGADCAHAQLTAEAAWFVEGRGGLGMEGRLGRHFPLNVDLRGFGRVRPSVDSALYLTDTYGNSFPVLSSQSAFLFNTGCAYYF